MQDQTQTRRHFPVGERHVCPTASAQIAGNLADETESSLSELSLLHTFVPWQRR